ncbi:MAG: DUF6541 family protein [Thermoflexales bacterium]
MVSIARFKAPARMMVLAFAALSLTACGGPLVEAGQPAANAGSLPLTATSSLGQSLMAYQGGLQGIEFQLAPAAQRPSGRVTYQLRRRADVADILAGGAIDVGAPTGDALRIDFPPQSAERLQDFYIELQYAGPDGLSLLTGPASAYLNGAAYVNGQPREAQLSFRLFHAPAQAGVGLAWLFGTWLLIAGAVAALLIFPGLAMLLLLPAASRASAGRLDLLFLAPSVSLGIYPVLIVLTGLVGLRFGPLYAWLPIALAAAALLPRIWKRRQALSVWIRARHRPTIEHIVLFGVVAMTVFSRLWAIRALEVPMWGDSYQHSVLTQLLLDRNGLFNDWAPYADMLSLTYHVGFHSVSAALGWVTGLSGAQSVMWMGQFLNIAAVMALYPAAKKMARSAWAGIFAVALAGLVSTYPAYYVNWGRYTQLAGQVILPGLIWLIWTTIERARLEDSRRNRFALIGVMGLVWAGLGLSHYRILILGLIFGAATLVSGTWLLKLNRRSLLTLAAGGALGALLFAPWLLHTLEGTLTNTAAQLLTTPAGQTPDSILAYNEPSSLFQAFFPATWVLVLLAFLVGLWRRNAHTMSLLIWTVLMIAATNPGWLSLPGAGIISNFALAIFLYVPFCLVAAVACADVLEILARRTLKTIGIATRALAALAILVASGVGLVARSQEVRPDSFALYLRPDARAAAWIAKNTVATARFLVDSFSAYRGDLIAGSDGGWWLPLTARRATTQPPLNYSQERLDGPSRIEWINALPIALRAEGLSAANIARLRERGITHIFVGQARGRVGAPAGPMLDPAALLADPRLRLVYRQDRVLIFEIGTPSP